MSAWCRLSFTQLTIHAYFPESIPNPSNYPCTSNWHHACRTPRSQKPKYSRVQIFNLLLLFVFHSMDQQTRRKSDGKWMNERLIFQVKRLCCVCIRRKSWLIRKVCEAFEEFLEGKHFPEIRSKLNFYLRKSLLDVSALLSMLCVFDVGFLFSPKIPIEQFQARNSY